MYALRWAAIWVLLEKSTFFLLTILFLVLIPLVHYLREQYLYILRTFVIMHSSTRRWNVWYSSLYLLTKAVTKMSSILIYLSFAISENPTWTNKDSILRFKEGVTWAYDWITSYVTCRNQNNNNMNICKS